MMSPIINIINTCPKYIMKEDAAVGSFCMLVNSYLIKKDAFFLTIFYFIFSQFFKRFYL